jgi:hypothetical protein
MTTTPEKTKDEIIAVLVAALAVAKGRSEATVRCEFGLEPATAPLTQIGSLSGEHHVPERQEEMLLSA